MKDDKGATSKSPSDAIQGSLAISFFLTYIIILLIIAVITVYATRTKAQYFLEAPNGAVKEVFPLNEPNVTPTAILKWSALAATSAYTIDFYHYQENIDALKDFFTVDGYQDYLTSLQSSDSLNRIVKDKLIQSAVTTNTPVILQEGITNGVYTWRIQVPILVTYQGASTQSSFKNLAVSLLVIRVPTDIAAKGIGIAQIVDTDLHVQN
jgi:intracellular multiplication protein IcmL